MEHVIVNCWTGCRIWLIYILRFVTVLWIHFDLTPFSADKLKDKRSEGSRRHSNENYFSSPKIVLRPISVVCARSRTHFMTSGITLKWSLISRLWTTSSVTSDSDWFQLTGHRKQVSCLKRYSGNLGKWGEQRRPKDFVRQSYTKWRPLFVIS